MNGLPRLLLLGEPRIRKVTGAGAPVESVLPGIAMSTLLAMLAVQPGRVVPSEHLVEQIWPSVAGGTARSRLHVQVSRLRGRLRGTGMEISHRRGGYLLLGDPATVDLYRFTQLIVRAQQSSADADWPAVLRSTAAARALWRGEPFADMAAEALDLERSHLSERYRSMVELECRALLGLGRPREAVVAAEELMRTDPYGECGVSALMTALTRSGRRADALAVFDGFRRSLAEELGLDPSEALRELQREVLRGDPSGAPEASPASGTASVAAPGATVDRMPHLFGRDRELASIEALLTDLRRGRAGTVLLEGETGIGRSALARQAAAAAERRGLRVVRARGTDALATPALSLWRQVAGRLGLGSGIAAEAGEPPTVVSVQTLVDAVLAAVRAQPTLLVLDDVHRADDASVVALEDLVRAVWDEPLGVIATREFHGVPSTPAKEQAWTRISQAQLTRTFELQPLALAEVAAMAEVSEPRAHELLRRTGGNPRLLTELVRSPRTAREAEGLPCGIRSLVRSRVVGVPPMTRYLLGAAAVAGPRFDPRVLGRALRVAEDDVLHALCAAVESGVVQADFEGAHWFFRHEIYRDGVLSMIAGARRLELERLLGPARTGARSDRLPNEGRGCRPLGDGVRADGPHIVEGRHVEEAQARRIENSAC